MEPTDFWERAWTAAVIRCKRARNPPEAHQRRTAERLKASYAEMDTGHYPMLSEPEALTRLLLGPNRPPRRASSAQRASQLFQKYMRGAVRNSPRRSRRATSSVK